MTATTTDTPQQAPTAAFPDEVITRTPVQDIDLPGGAGTLALITLDNGFDHTKPNTFGPATVAGLRETVDTLAQRAAAGEIQAVGITGKPFVFAVGADLTGGAKLRGRDFSHHRRRLEAQEQEVKREEERAES